MKKTNENKTAPAKKTKPSPAKSDTKRNTSSKEKSNYDEEDMDELDSFNFEDDFLTENTDEFDFDRELDFEEFDLPPKKKDSVGKKKSDKKEMNDEFDDFDFLNDEFDDFDEEDDF